MQVSKKFKSRCFIRSGLFERTIESNLEINLRSIDHRPRTCGILLRFRPIEECHLLTPSSSSLLAFPLPLIVIASLNLVLFLGQRLDIY